MVGDDLVHSVISIFNYTSHSTDSTQTEADIQGMIKRRIFQKNPAARIAALRMGIIRFLRTV